MLPYDDIRSKQLQEYRATLRKLMQQSPYWFIAALQKEFNTISFDRGVVWELPSSHFQSAYSFLVDQCGAATELQLADGTDIRSVRNLTFRVFPRIVVATAAPERDVIRYHGKALREQLMAAIADAESEFTAWPVMRQTVDALPASTLRELLRYRSKRPPLRKTQRIGAHQRKSLHRVVMTWLAELGYIRKVAADVYSVGAHAWVKCNTGQTVELPASEYFDVVLFTSMVKHASDLHGERRKRNVGREATAPFQLT